MVARFFHAQMNTDKEKMNKGEKMKIKKGQSILEYILVAVVFATVGVGTFITANHVLVKEHRGLEDNYQSQDTLIGQVLQDDYSEQVAWPEEQEQQTAIAQKEPQDTDWKPEDDQDRKDQSQGLDEDQWGEVISEGLEKIEEAESGDL